METKVCSKCGRELPIDHFWKDARAKDGLNGRCVECVSKYQNDIRAKLKGCKPVIKDAPKVEENTLKEISENHIENIPSRLLISELRRRGYRGELELVTIQKVVI